MEPRNLFDSSHKDQIVLTKRQISMMMASMLIVCLFVFITGYFLGKRTVIDDSSLNLTHNVLHDQIDYLLTTQSLQSSQEELMPEEVIQEEVIVEPVTFKQDQPAVQQKVVTLVTDQEKTMTMPTKKDTLESVEENKISDVLPASNGTQGRQYACLVGFGTKKAAQAFVTRLQKHHITVQLKTVISKTATGKPRTWFQAITQTYNSSQELQSVVDKVKRLEHIRDSDIKIIYVK